MPLLKSRRPAAVFSKWDLPLSRRHFWQEFTPPQLLVASFLLLILIGTLGFMLIPGLYADPSRRLSALDSLFTATSAVCVTGLVVVDTATYFTFWGQAYILLLIQLGGLSVIALTSLVIIAIGQRLSLRHEALALAGAEVLSGAHRNRLVRDVVLFTFSIELVGALCLFPLFAWRTGWQDALWHSLFHSVSAFCNAGFSTFPDSLISFQHNPGVQAVIMLLIILGGIGFLTLEELYLYQHSRRYNRRFRVSLHSRIVLVTTAILILAPIPLFAAFEWSATFKDLSAPAVYLNAAFLSVTARTAGFNVIDYAQATDSTNFLTILLMSIGGSPGSTAGGLKTTTFALLGLLAWSRFRGREVVSIGSRSVREETIQRAIGIFVVAFGIVTVAIFAITATERFSRAKDHSFLAHMFEAASAFNTVGLSMNLTPTLTPGGKLTTILLMFVGRVGLLTLAAALARRAPTGAGELRYAYEDVVVG